LSSANDALFSEQVVFQKSQIHGGTQVTIGWGRVIEILSKDVVRKCMNVQWPVLNGAGRAGGRVWWAGPEGARSREICEDRVVLLQLCDSLSKQTTIRNCLHNSGHGSLIIPSGSNLDRFGYKHYGGCRVEYF
jgi:hypothetical protein